MADAPKGIRVIAEDLETGEGGTVEIMDDYVLIAAGTCRVTHTQVHANGTHVVTITGSKRRKP